MDTVPPDTEETLRRARKALKADPRNLTLHALIAKVYEDLGRYAEAGPHLSALHSANFQPDEALYARYALALQRAGQFENAIRLVTEGIRHFPRSIWLMRTKALTLMLSGRLEQAVDVYTTVCAIDPSDVHSAGMIGTLKLLMTDLQDGYHEYANRPMDKALAGLFSGIPRWRGEPLSGKAIALWSEQGIGDVVMFLGLLPWIANRGAKISLVVTAKLAPLVSRSFPGVEIVSENGLAGIGSRFDLQMPLGDLLQHAIAEVKPAERPAFLIADKQRAGILREAYELAAAKHGRTRLVGLSWHTTNPDVGFTRNISLQELQPVLSVPGVQFISLQYGQHSEEIAESNRRVKEAIFTDSSIDAFNDLDGLAAQMSAMDEIITIDNATVHLAGALGVPTTLLLPTVPDWRWGLSSPECKWYRSVRLERQEAILKWKPVVKRVRTHLLEQVGAAA